MVSRSDKFFDLLDTYSVDELVEAGRNIAVDMKIWNNNVEACMAFVDESREYFEDRVDDE